MFPFRTSSATVHLLRLLRRAELADVTVHGVEIVVHSSPWVEWLRSEQSSLTREGEQWTSEPADASDIRTVVRFSPWILHGLDGSQLRCVLQGLHLACGDFSVDGQPRALHTLSLRLRDELQLLCLHAGYSSTFTRVGDVWRVTYTDAVDATHPSLLMSTTVKRGKLQGRVWCVDAPPHRLIIARRAVVDEGTDEVIAASRPCVVGNCLFGKGLTLDTPERVPFRLTANVIDGFGLTGIEGVFRTSCEVTMKVMKENAQTLLSVLHTFLYDPLLEWKQSGGQPNQSTAPSLVSLLPPPAAVANAGGGAALQSLEFTTAAEKLNEVELKLSGVVNVHAKDSFPLSVNAQVDSLIKEACSEHNLAQMYMGWMPWI